MFVHLKPCLWSHCLRSTCWTVCLLQRARMGGREEVIGDWRKLYTQGGPKVSKGLIKCTVVFDVTAPQWAWASSFTRFLDHTQRHITFGRTPLDEWPARRRYLYLTTHNNQNRQTSMPPVGFKPTVSAGERPQTYALDRAATGTGSIAVVSRNTVQEGITLQKLPWAQI